MKEDHLNTILAVIIAISGVLTGYAAFKSAAINSTSNDNYFAAQVSLTDANLLYTEQGQEALYERITYDKYLEYEDDNEKLANYFYGELSDIAKESEKRKEGPFDELYYDALLKDAESEVEDHDESFRKAAHDSNRAVAYQLTTVILAIALAFAGWSSLSQGSKKARYVFGALSLVALISALIQMFTIAGPLSS